METERRVHYVMVVVIALLSFLEMVYAIRLQMKLASLTCLLAAITILWLWGKGGDVKSRADWIHLFAVCSIVVGAAIISCWLLVSAGPQPFRAQFTLTKLFLGDPP